jgi:hypothetical protein
MKYVWNSINPGILSDAMREKTNSGAFTIRLSRLRPSKPFKSGFQHPLLLSLIRNPSPRRRDCVFLSPSVPNPHLRLQSLSQQVIHPRLDIRECSLVPRLLLHPNDLLGFRVPLQRDVELFEGEGRNLFQPDECDPVGEVPGLAFLDEVVVELSSEEDYAVHVGCIGDWVVQDRFEPSVRHHLLERGRRGLCEQSELDMVAAKTEAWQLTGRRSNPLGAATTSGFR